MSPLKTLKCSALKKALLKKGFRQYNSSHEHFLLYVNGKKHPVGTMLSFGQREVGANMMHIIGKQLCLEPPEFEDFVKCPLTHEKYVQLLRGKGQNL